MTIPLIMLFCLLLCPQTMFTWLTRLGWALLWFVGVALLAAIVL